MIANQVALIRRELWEHRSIYVTPLVIALIVSIMAITGHAVVSAFDHAVDLAIIGATNLGATERAAAITVLMTGVASLLIMAMWVLTIFYCLDALYAERKDRSILFWRSMPLSDTSTVLSKLFTGMVTAPAFTFVLIVIAEIIAGIIFIIAAGIVGVNLLHVAFYPGTIVLTWIVLAFALIQQSLWLVPYWGWFLLCSAWSRKYSLVLAWAILIPGVAMLLELITFHTHHLADGILGHIGRGAILLGGYAMQSGPEGLRTGFIGGNGHHIFGSSHNVVMSFGSVAHMFTLPEMWIGVGIGIVFILGAIWLRRNRAEI